MELSHKQVGTVTVLNLDGKLTIEDQGRLKDRVSRLVAEGHKSVVLNLGGLTYMDSAGLGEIVSCHTRAVNGGGAIALCNTTKRIQDLLISTKLVNVVASYDSEQEAVASFS